MTANTIRHTKSSLPKLSHPHARNASLPFPAAGAHFGWLHFGFGKHSARHAGSGAPTISDTSPHLPSHLWNFGTAARMSYVPRIPPTLLWSPPLFQTRPNGRVSFVSSAVRLRRGFFFNRFPCFSSSGCFFNGVI
jgi:hypothetical protein